MSFSALTPGHYLVMALLATAAAFGQSPAASPRAKAPAPAAKQPVEPPLEWRDVTTWGVEGRAFGDMERQRWFDRFPSVAEGKVTDAVWRLSRDSAGMMVRFNADATLIRADVSLRADRMAGPIMTAIGAMGVVLCASEDAGKWRWVGVTGPEKKVVLQQIIAGLKPGFPE